jgi:hypothetical protein
MNSEGFEGLTRQPIVQIVSQLLLSPFTASSSIPCVVSKLRFSDCLIELYQLRDLTWMEVCPKVNKLLAQQWNYFNTYCMCYPAVATLHRMYSTDFTADCKQMSSHCSVVGGSFIHSKNSPKELAASCVKGPSGTLMSTFGCQCSPASRLPSFLSCTAVMAAFLPLEILVLKVPLVCSGAL